ncbi:MAG: hypothetical protein U5K84_03940 [Alkalibacterium sp.]|nr:hypothetical protein [Alkalibacterium sp.]
MLLAGVFTYSIVNSDERAELEESTQTANDSEEEQQVKIGILQTTSHPALDAITEGSIDCTGKRTATLMARMRRSSCRTHRAIRT